MKTKTVTELVIEGFDDGGFRAEHALACAMADASPKLKTACTNAVKYLKLLPASVERDAMLLQLNEAITLASTPASQHAS